MARRAQRGVSPALALLFVALFLATAQAQFPGDRLPIEEVSVTDIFRACEVPIESEFSEGDSYPQSLMGVGVSGTWAYEQTSLGMIRNPSLLSSTGKIDMWISNDTASGGMGLLHDVSAVFYLTGQAARNDALESTVMVRSRGQYVPSKGVLCLLGCQESLLPTLFTAKGQNITGGVAGGVGDGDMIDEPEAPTEDENVEAGVAHPIPISQEMETQCRTRIVMRFSLKELLRPFGTAVSPAFGSAKCWDTLPTAVNKDSRTAAHNCAVLHSHGHLAGGEVKHIPAIHLPIQAMAL